MKKTIIFALMVLLTSCVFAQNSVITMTGSGDTITDSGNDYVLVNVLGTFNTVTLQAVLTKLTGNVGTVTVTVTGSVDGTNFVALNSDDLSCTNVTTNTKTWVIEGSSYLWYKINFDGNGTQTSRVYGYMLGNPSSGKHTSVAMLNVSSVATSTVTNTATGYCTKRSRAWYDDISIQAVVTKVSGTAAGTVTLQGSLDGTNFVTVPTNYLFDVTGQEPYKVDDTATLTVTDVTTSTKIFTVIGSPFQYYRLSYTGSGTMVCTLKGYFLGNKK
jgi:hypothetical protein